MALRCTYATYGRPPDGETLYADMLEGIGSPLMDGGPLQLSPCFEIRPRGDDVAAIVRNDETYDQRTFAEHDRWHTR